MTALAADMSSTADLITVTGGSGFDRGAFFTIDDEVIQFEGYERNQTYGRELWTVNEAHWYVQRGLAGTTAASHLSGAILTRYYPDAPGGDAIGAGSTTLSGPVEIVPPDDESDPSLHISTPVGNATFRLLIDSPDGDGSLSVGDEGQVQVDSPTARPFNVQRNGSDVLLTDGDGKLRVTPTANDTSAQPALVVDALAAIANLLRLRTGADDVVTVTKDGSMGVTLRGGYFQISNAGAPVVVVGVDALQFLLAEGNAFEVLDSTFATAFKVAADGTVHIKTGASIVADL
jgi:hypothetical protein